MTIPLTTEIPERVGVLVVGGGLAGCASLLAAAEVGQYAMLVESESDIGGSTVKSAGLYAFAGTAEQDEAGIDDSVELLREDLVAVGRGLSDPAMIDLYCNNQYETYIWLKERDIAFGELHAASAQSVPRSHPTDSTGMLHQLLDRAGQLGARVSLNTKVDRLITDGQRVTAVEVTRDGITKQIMCDAVVLASGGFSRNEHLIDTYAPQLSEAVRGGGVGSRGDGLAMAIELGAATADMDQVRGTYGIYPEPHPHEDGTGILAVYKGAIAVNNSGHRFVDESKPYKEIGDANLLQPGARTFQIFDQSVLALTSDETPIYDFAGRRNSGLLTEASSLTELAEKIGVPAQNLEETVAAYNAAIAGVIDDEYSRTSLSGGYGAPTPIEAAPFFAHWSGTVVLATYCGLRVDESMRVLNESGEPIERLYAAGEIVGGFHGGGYMTGTAIGKAAIFGRIAGTTAAQEESELQW